MSTTTSSPSSVPASPSTPPDSQTPQSPSPRYSPTDPANPPPRGIQRSRARPVVAASRPPPARCHNRRQLGAILILPGSATSPTDRHFRNTPLAPFHDHEDFWCCEDF